MLVFPLSGYLFGRYLRTTGEENYDRMVGRGEAPRGKAEEPRR
jgi:hypothetical protein